MIVTKIQLANWMNADDSSIELPTKGYVLITGPNGEGKSSFQEAVAYARSSTTLRKANPWRDKTEGSILVEGLDGHGKPIAIERSVNAGGKVSGKIDGEDQATSTKATQAIEKRLGSLESWTRSSVFTGDALSSFVDATDMQRKEILESFLGVDRFEPAIKIARSDAKIYNDRKNAAEQRMTWLEEELDRIEGEKKAIEDQAPTEARPFDALIAECDQAIAGFDSDVEEASARKTKIEESIRRIRDELEHLRATNSSASTTVQVLGRRKAQVVEGDCPTCASSVDAEHVAKIRTLIDAEATQAEKLVATTGVEIQDARERVAKLESLKQEIQTTIDTAQAERRKVESERSALERDKANHEAGQANREDQIKRLQEEFERKDREADEVDAEVEALKEHLLINQCAQLALSPKGVRSILLTRSLTAIERAANRYLARLFPGARIKISPSRQLANGSIVEEIDFQITGVASDRGFEALSTGQKKRILLAVLMAMATLARGALGPSTLWLDEALDGLDDEGLDAVCEMVRDVSAEVPVVVISHREELLEKLARGAEEWFHVSKGKALPRSTRAAADDGTKRFVPDGEIDEPTHEVGASSSPDKSNGTGRRRRAGRATKASAPKANAPTPRKGGKDGARGRRSARSA